MREMWSFRAPYIVRNDHNIEIAWRANTSFTTEETVGLLLARLELLAARIPCDEPGEPAAGSTSGGAASRQGCT